MGFLLLFVLAPFLSLLLPAGLTRRAPVFFLLPPLVMAAAFGAGVVRLGELALFRIPFLFLPGREGLALVFSGAPQPLTMAVLAVGMGFLVQAFSVAYLGGHPRQKLFHLLTGLFQVAMAGLFLARSFFTLVFFWEWVGIFSYLLVQFWYEKNDVLRSGFRVLMINKAGDFFLLAFAGLLVSFGLSSTVFTESGFPAGAAVFLSSPAGMAAVLFLVMAAAIKSAQFPFSVWLREAMAGPAPVSALLHSATMVLSGVWVLYQVLPWIPAPVRSCMVVLGAAGMVPAFAEAAGSLYLKRTLAALTLASLSTLVLVLGTGNGQAIPFYLLAHAFYKAPLFLLCGWLMKQAAAGGFQARDAEFFPVLAGRLKGQYGVQAILILCLASMAGVPLTSGFVAHECLIPPEGSAWTLQLARFMLQASFLVSGFVALRLGHALLVSSGEPAGPAFRRMEAGYFLPFALASCGTLWVLFGWNPLSASGLLTRFWDVPPREFFPLVPAALAGAGIALALLRFFPGVVFSTRASVFWSRVASIPLTPADFSGRVVQTFARGAVATDRRLIDRSLERGGKAAVVLGYFSAFLDRMVVDGLVDVLSGMVRLLGRYAWNHIRRYPQYVIWFGVTVLLLVLYLAYYF